MTPLTFVLLSGSLTFGIPLALAIRELLDLGSAPPAGDEPPPDTLAPRAPRPLPDCLLPAPAPVFTPARVRALEDA